MSGTWIEMIHETARKYGVDPERAQVWETFSNLYLDTAISNADLDKFAKSLAQTRFSIPELVHIYDKEVNPVCMWNLFAWEWAGFHPDWPIPRCAEEQRLHPYKKGGKQRFSPPFSFAFSYADACSVFESINKLRQSA